MKNYSLSELCDKIELCVANNLSNVYSVVAEISNMQVRGGHCYMELIEKGDSTIYKAKVRAVCWASTYAMLHAYFSQQTGQSISNGMKVLLDVKVTFHAVYGLSLVIVGIDPNYTLGSIQRQRELTIKRLQDDGTFEMNRSLDFPVLPQRIAVVSARGAAGYEDFLNQLTSNSSRYAFRVTLFEAVMQGDRAVDSICSALDCIAEQAENFDLVVITRGGGSSNDLTCFDNYELCSECAQFPLPIISAIGHTKDVAVVDMVSFQALKTPTAAAAFLIEKMDVQADGIADLERRLKLFLTNLTSLKMQQLENYKSAIVNAMHLKIEKQLSQLDLMQKTVELHSPQYILKQGYTITMLDGKPLSSVKDLKRGMVLTTDMADGSVESVVK